MIKQIQGIIYLNSGFIRICPASTAGYNGDLKLRGDYLGKAG
jgi:hypothetical protein